MNNENFWGKIIKVILFPFRKKKTIVFESSPDFADNAYPVYLYVKEHYPIYKLVWLTSCHTKTDLPRVYYDSDGLWQKLRFEFCLRTCGAIITSNHFYRSFYNKQFSLFLTHGSKTKETRGLYEPGPAVDFINIQSHFFDKVVEYGYDARKEQLVYLGYPRCDWLFKKVDILTPLKEIGVNGRYLIWLPTFRKNRSHLRDAHSELFENMGIPLIYNEDMLNSLNDFLVSKNLHIIYKPHPAQDVSSLTNARPSNIHIINDVQLFEHDLQLYQIIACSEALITDYSSVYFDYLLLNKPIATTLDDVDLWKSVRGFAFDLESMYAKTNESLYSLDDLLDFIQTVVIEGRDTRSEARKEVMMLTNKYIDGDSAKRVAEFVINKMQG